MAKKKLKMTDTKVRAVVVSAILLAFILALYLIFKEPTKVCPKGQTINASGKCVDDPNFCSQAVGKSWKCTQKGQCVFQTNGNECRDCADPDEVYAEANPATVAFLNKKDEGMFGVENLLSNENEYTCQRKCLNNTECQDGGTCASADIKIDDNKTGLGPKPNVCKYKPIWYGVPTASNNSYVCKPYSPGRAADAKWNIPKKGGAYKSLKACAMDKWEENDSKVRPAGFAVGDYKNNNCPKSGACYDAWTRKQPKYKTETDCTNQGSKWFTAGSPKLNADNTDCNTYPCTENALGGWGSSRIEGAASNESNLYLYQKPQKDGPSDADESQVGTCFKTYKKNDQGLEEPTTPQVPDENDFECNGQPNEKKCREAAYPDKDSKVPHCKWYPAGSCLRIPKKLDPPTVDFDGPDGIILDNKNLEDIKKNKKATKTDFPNFYGGKSQDYWNTTKYPKVLDYDPTISNCKHKLMAQGATDDEAAELCGNLNEGEEFNPLEFRRCAGVIANKDPGYPTFHTTMQPFLVKTFNEKQKISAKKSRTYTEEKNLSPSADSAPTSKDQAGNELECVPLKKKSNGAPCDDSNECIDQAKKRCDITPDCNGFFLYTDGSGRWCPKSLYTPDVKNPTKANGTFYHTDNDPTRYTPGLVVSLGSSEGNIGVSNTNVYCARGASCAGKDGDAVTAAKAALDNKISGLTKENTLFPVADTYCEGCDLTSEGARSNNWCKAVEENNSKWSTSKNVKKVTMTNTTGIAPGRTPEVCFNNWFKDFTDACGKK